MKIQTATDFNEISVRLRSELSALNYNPDLKKMLKNIEKMVDELSKQEVEARRNRSHNIEKLTENINTSINHLEKLILIAKIMQ